MSPQNIPPTCSLVVSTYNWPQALRLSLESVRAQTALPAEVIVADDGSGPDTARLVRELSEHFPVPLVHVWQPDAGYQLARIRNRAFAAAKGEYILQVDGDLILHPSFVADHLRAARPGTFISGARALLSPGFSDVLLQRGQLAAIPKKALVKRYNAVQAPLLSRLWYLFQRGQRQAAYVLGCNMAFWRKDLLAVNGYNEAFSGWGKEDNDIAIRLLNAGVALRFIKFGGIVYHLHHPEAARPTLAENEALLEASRQNKTTFVAKGLDQYFVNKVN